MATNEPLPVEFDELLAAEFNYIAQTAIQANEDRARVSSFYLIAVGSLVAAMFGAQYIDSTFLSIDVNVLFSGLFVLLTLMGTSTILQLARLRSAWYESALAMNQLKDYMMGQNQTLTQAFRWTTGTLPSKHKKDSISYYQAMEVALISGLMFGAAIFFLEQATLSLGSFSLIPAAVLGVASVFLQLSIYQRVLN
jgi:hypothetical protein